MGIIKKVGYGVVGIIAIGVISTAVHPKEEAKPVQKVAEVPTPKAETSTGVSEDNYNKIVQGDYTGEGGTSKDEVFAMFGDAKTFTTSKVNNDTIEAASWNTKDYKVMIMVTFTNGKVSSKTITKL